MTPALGTRNTGRIGATDLAVLESIHQHRLLSTHQVHALHMPDRSRRWTRQVLARLREAGLVAMIPAAPAGLGQWLVTERGADAIETIPSRTEMRRRVYEPLIAAGPLAHHTIAVNEVGVAFVKAARECDDRCGPLAWRHEIAHSLGPPPGRRRHEQLIADAILTYERNDPDEGTAFYYRFIELDRNNRPSNDLAIKLGRYEDLYPRIDQAAKPGALPEPVWARHYPAFPTPLVALANGSRKTLERRRDIVLALCRQDRRETLDLSVCLLDDLMQHGPFAPIFRTIDAPDKPVDWLGRQSER
jgi:hypothetical protein